MDHHCKEGTSPLTTYVRGYFATDHQCKVSTSPLTTNIVGHFSADQ